MAHPVVSRDTACLFLNMHFRTLSSNLFISFLLGFGGTCLSGKCQSAGFLSTAKAWYVQNLQISIPVTVLAGLVALLVLYALIRGIIRCCGRRSRGPTPILIPSTARTATHERLVSSDNRGAATRSPPSNMPGSRTSYTRVPPASHERGGSRGASQDMRFNYATNNRSNWVDETAYNGPGR
ncbi:hypothetical protein BJ165DRAFT_1485297 [Panaeolus papilionaceus]|nr:hypothetical protein BJ165DRAFT_1485297 [Panaeolus papilionaceus]